MGSLEELVCIVNSKGVITQRTQPNVEILEEAGFLILRKESLELSDAQIKALGFTSRESRNLYTMGPVVAMLVRRIDAFEAMASIYPHLDDLYYSSFPYTAQRDSHILFPPTHVLERSVIIIKPGYTQENLDFTSDALRQAGFVEIAQQGKILTEAEASAIFSGNAEDVKFMTSGFSVILVVEKLGAVTDLLLLLGPTAPALAKQLAPASLRAVLGDTQVQNALYASPTAQQALKDIELLFPEPFESERTLAIIKPDAFRFWNDIKNIVTANGFHILIEEKTVMSMQRAEEFYAQAGGEDNSSVSGLAIESTHLSSGPVMVVLLYKPACVDSWIKLVGGVDCKGKGTLRAQFATGAIANGFYCSATPTQAEKDINFFFPQLPRAVVPAQEEVKTLIRSKPSNASNAVSLHEVLVKGLTHLCQVKPTGLDAITELANWLLRNNPNQPLVEHAVEEPPQISVQDELKAASGEPHVVCLVGGDIPLELAEEEPLPSYEVVNVGELVEHAIASGSELGRVLNATLALGRPAPSHMIMSLLRGAMLKSNKNKFLLTQFPHTLDLALAFEEQICPINMLLFIDQSQEARIEADSESRALSIAKVKEFQDDIEPVLEHFGVFGKLRTSSGLEFDLRDQWSALFDQAAVSIPEQPQEMPVPPRRQVEKPKLEEDD